MRIVTQLSASAQLSTKDQGRRPYRRSLGALLAVLILGGCADGESRLNAAGGGTQAAGSTGEGGAGGKNSGGAGNQGGKNQGGAGQSQGGKNQGGNPQGGKNQGGAGNPQGGKNQGGAGNQGGNPQGGKNQGGAGNQGENPGNGALGEADRPENGAISLKEEEIHGTVAGGVVTVSFPVLAGAKDASGMLSVALRSVDDTKEIAAVQVPYSVLAGGTQVLTAQLTLPPGITRASDWVGYNVRVTDGQKGGLRATRSLLTVISPYEVTLTGPATVARGKTASYRVRTEHPRTKAPLGGASVSLKITKNGVVTSTFTGTTSATGEAVFELSLDEGGDYQIAASAQLNETSDAVSSPFAVKLPDSRVLLTTDKPIYQPGQTIHLRALALTAGANTPLSQQPATLEVEDGKGNKIFKRAATSDDHGIVAADFTIGSVVNTGSFKVRATVGATKSEKTVTVGAYALPKFKVNVQTDKAWYLPGDQLTATIDSAYFFGKPVAGGSVTVEASTLDVGQTVFQTVQGKLDGSGKLSFGVKVPSSLVGLPIDNGNALVDLKVTIVDTAGQQVQQEHLVTVSPSGLDVALVPESTALVPGVENHLDLFASDPLGNPIPGAAVTLSFPDQTTADAVTDAFGHLTVSWTPPADLNNATISAAIGLAGKQTQATFNFGVQQGTEHLVVRTDKSVYGVGESVEVGIRCTKPSDTVYIDWINGGQTVDMRTIEVKDGAATFSLPVDATVNGSNRVEAYVVDDQGSIVRVGRTFFVRSGGSLAVSLETDKPQYEPGQSAKLTFSVKDEAGNPQVAALGVQVVDEAVFGLVESKPGLLQTYFQLESDFSQPSYEIHGPGADFSALLLAAPDPADPAKAAAQQQQAGAAFAAMGDKVPNGLSLASGPQLLADAQTKLATPLSDLQLKLLMALAQSAKSAVFELTAEGCTPDQYYCPTLQKDYVVALSEQVSGKLGGLIDFWGNPFVNEPYSSYYGVALRSLGPDEIAQTPDDKIFSFPWSQLGVQLPNGGGDPFGEGGSGGAGNFFGGGGEAGSGGASAGGSDGAGASAGGGTGPKVRKDFPETLYVNPSIITGPDGTATVEIPMADSITTWRVSTLANSASGKLGGGLGGIKVFQDFFADISFPATLTRGDEVTFPVAVYNYLDTPQTVSVQLSPGDWYTALGSTQLSVDLGPGEVKGVSVPVRVEKVGVQTLTVKAIGTTKSDAVARMVKVIPDGKEIAKATSGALGAGQISLGASFPAGAVEGSPHLHLDVYPAFLSQVVSGVDSILQTPNGCFEQTTSTTWPNVLVLAYLKQTNQLTPAVQLKAETLISAGYQRLLTFEHPGGGFSWFGTQDPAPYLSVTAFGVMEFGDMAKVYDIDPAMLQRTALWLMNQQQPDGSWKGDTSEFFTFNTSTLRNTAFTSWALASAGFAGPQVDAGIGYVKSHLQSEQDSYTLGIAANALAEAHDPMASALLDQLDAAKLTKGEQFSWSTAGTQTDFYGQGQDADVTSTALITRAMLTAGGYGPTVNGALQYLVSSRDSQGNFGSTQATIWTLRALLLAASKGTEGAVGTLDVAVDGAPFSSVSLTADQPDVLHTVDLSSLATTGDHQVELSFVGTGKISYNLVARHNLPWKDTGEAPPGPLSIAVSYDKTTLVVNDTVTATASLTNTTDATENMVLVTLGIPPGFEVLGEDLDAYLAAGTLSRHETTGKQLILYVPKLSPKATQIFSYRLRATLPVKAEDGGSQVFPYYQPDAVSSASSTTFLVSAN
jgi:hypothetical protein